MNKYDVALDLKSGNSLSTLLNFIKPETEILEFGPSNGRLTQYLHEQNRCTVDIVEWDEILGNKALPFTRTALLGKTEGSIENFYWEKALAGRTYDAIIFADVLEHLYNPTEVLARTRPFLKENGAVIISVPNIGYDGILYELFAEEFNYRPLGLLDNTHLRFFTYKTLLELIATAGFKTVEEQATILAPEHSEFAEHVRHNKMLRNYLTSRNFGHVYQFIFVLHPSERKESQPAIKLTPHFPNQIKLYIQDKQNQCFTEQKTIIEALKDGKITFDLSMYPDVTRVRLDPGERQGIVNLKSVPQNLTLTGHNAALAFNSLYLFNAPDPQFYFQINTPEKTLTFSLELNPITLETLTPVFQNVPELQQSLAELTDHNLKLQQSLQNIMHSTSWKITKPLRRLGRLFKKNLTHNDQESV